MLISGLVLLASCRSVAPPQQTNATERPQRIVSMNPCIDAVLAEIADPKIIAGVSHYSQRAASTSVDLRWAMQFPATGDSAESAIALRPDLVLIGAPAPPQTVAAFNRLGVASVAIVVPQSIDESIAQVRTIGRAIGATEKAEHLVQRIRAAQARARPAANQVTIPAIVRMGGGLVPGPDSLPGELMASAGLRNISKDMGLADWGYLAIEPMLVHPPRVILTPDAAPDGALNRAVALLDRAGHRVVLARYPDRLSNCAGPHLVDALDRLTAIRNGMKPAS